MKHQPFLINLKVPPELEGEEVFYIGRPSPLGNPFPLRSESERDACVERYGVWLRERVKVGDARVMGALTRIKLLLETKDVGLQCYCAPKRCHGEMIIAVLGEMS